MIHAIKENVIVFLAYCLAICGIIVYALTVIPFWAIKNVLRKTGIMEDE
jgi:hypothetical protein